MDNEIQIVCRYSFCIYQNDNYRVCRYEYEEKPIEERRRDFVASGNNLPEIKGTSITLHGQWKTDKKGQRSFHVTSFSIDLPTSMTGVIEYFKFMKCGVGQDKARAIYDKFGENIWFICQNQPERLREVSGLSDRNIQRILIKLKETRTQMEILQMFRGSNVPMTKINRIVEHFGPTAAAALKENPYIIARMDGFNFNMADTIALNQGVDPVNINRRKASVLAALDQAASQGHVCLPRDMLIKSMLRILDSVKYPQITDEMCDAAIVATLSEKTTANTSGFIYAIERYRQEKHIVSDLMRLMQTPSTIPSVEKLNAIIVEYEAQNNIKMAESQKAAVICAMTHQVCVMTGGPGTGKSTTAKAVLFCQNKLMQEATDCASNPILLSPTGKAARRLAESTSYPASTIHSGIQIYESSSEKTSEEVEFLSGDIILVDESSMADQHITYELLRRIPTGCKLIFVGDPNQLPSVGCGNILADLIRSKVIPVVKLSVIFRQAGDNPIVTNSMKIMANQTNLLYNNSFALNEIDDPEKIFEAAIAKYKRCVSVDGIDKVILLCPLRKSPILNVNRFNITLQDIINPKIANPQAPYKTMRGKSVFVSPDKSVTLEFRVGDKVMQTVNTDIAKNGDTGFVKDILYVDAATCGHTKVMKVEFNGDGVEHLLNEDQVRDLDLAYCSTIHKSQGEEYKNVIMVMSTLHEKWLQRNLFYTGITRAKENVYLIGEHIAIEAAIHNNSITKRYTLLSDRLHAKLPETDTYALT